MPRVNDWEQYVQDQIDEARTQQAELAEERFAEADLTGDEMSDATPKIWLRKEIERLRRLRDELMAEITEAKAFVYNMTPDRDEDDHKDTLDEQLILFEQRSRTARQQEDE